MKSIPLYRPLAISVGVGLAAASVLLLLVMLRLLVGPFEVLPQDETGTRGLQVRLWEPAALAGDSHELKAGRRRRWRAVLPAGAKLEPVAQLEAVPPANSLIAVADAAALDHAEARSLRDWIEAGGSALLTGWIATGGEARAGAAMRELLGVERVHVLRAEEAHSVSAGAIGPLSSGLAAELRVELAPAGPNPALADAAAEIRWSESGAAAALRRTLGRGRLVWLAFGPERAAGNPAGFEPLQRSFANAFAWASGEATAGLLARGPTEPVALALIRTGPHRVHLKVTNRGDEPARERIVRLYPNRPVGQVRASATVLFRDEPGVRVAGDHIDLLLPELGAGSSRDYAIDLLPPAS